MPIPPRPIPTHSRHRQRPRPSISPASSSPSTTGPASTATAPASASASALSRKKMTSGPSSLDWRAEITLLNELDRARSVPVNATRNVQMISHNQLLTVDNARLRQPKVGGDGSGGSERMEVGLQGLIEEGRGKREKRATTATTLGFDFIANPSIVALPDTADHVDVCTGHSSTKTTPKSSATIGKSLLSTTKSTLPPVTTARAANATGQPSPTLSASLPISVSGTPGTPGLVPRQSSSSPSEEEEEEDGDGDDDWELLHIPSVSQSGTARRLDKSISIGQRELQNDEDEDDVIVLGEMELEDEVERLIIEETTDRSQKSRKDVLTNTKTKAKADGGKRATYAAATAAPVAI
ncbi:hypothetical protein IAU59_007428 [Kwoniella sp. CBS 9459]